MARLEVNGILPDITYDTPFDENLRMSQTVQKADKTILLFLRYYGCTLCQYDMNELAENYEKIGSKGGQVLVVLQSDREKLAAQLQEKNAFPFDIICDPEQELYKLFEISPAASMAKMMDPKAMMKAAKATAAGYKHGDYEGEELQLPAAFIVDQDMKIIYAHYGKKLADIPDANELSELL